MYSTMSRRKKKDKSATFVLSGPTNFKSGIQVKKDETTGEIKGLPSQWSGKESDDLSVDKLDDESLPEVLRPQSAEQIIKDAEKRRMEKERREEEERKKAEKEKKAQQLSITGPVKVEHKLHVDKDLNWSEQSPDSLRLTQKLGEGAYGCVYKAIHVATEQEVAIKTVLFGAEEGEGVDEIKKEIDILKRCRHANIVSLYGCVQKGNELWIMMDYCSIGSVKDFMKIAGRNLSEAQATAVLYNVCAGLAYLHDIDIIHRDMKSANILINRDGQVKIADFGVSYRGDKTFSGHGQSVVGTPLFMSPQALNCSDAGSSSDIWSVGVTAIEMIDGNPPFHDEHVMRAMLLIATGPPSTVADPSKVSAEFNAFIARCLQMEDKDRPTAKELLEDDLFKDKDHLTELRAIQAEGHMLRLTKGGEQVDERILAQNNRASEEIATDEEESHDKPKKKSDKRAFKLKMESTKLSKSAKIESDDRRPSSARSPSSARGSRTPEEGFEKPMVWGRCTDQLDNTAASQAMQELLQTLQKELQVRKRLSRDIRKYESMSFKQIADEIVEMRSKVSKLERELQEM